MPADGEGCSILSESMTEVLKYRAAVIPLHHGEKLLFPKYPQSVGLDYRGRGQ